MQTANLLTMFLCERRVPSSSKCHAQNVKAHLQPQLQLTNISLKHILVRKSIVLCVTASMTSMCPGHTDRGAQERDFCFFFCSPQIRYKFTNSHLVCSLSWKIKGAKQGDPKTGVKRSGCGQVFSGPSLFTAFQQN